MVLTPSNMLELGVEAPDFHLTDVTSGERVSRDDFDGKDALLVMFISRHCPYVQHIADQLAELGSDYAGRSLGIVAISSNDIENYPDDAPDSLAEMARQKGYRFPVCFDETQEVAKAYRAACTPEFYLFDRDRRLVYRGQLDSSRPGTDAPVDGAALRTAIEAVLSGSPVAQEQQPSIGCNIKWKAGNEPDYFS